MKLNEYEKQHLRMLRQGLAECTVLLKSNGDFPLDGPCEIALYGSGVRHTIKGGTGSGDVNSRFTINVEQGFRKTGFKITTKAWLDAYDEVREKAQKAFVQEIRARARKKHTLAMIEGMGAVMPEPEYALPLDGAGDTALYVLSRTSGEGNDRSFTKGDITLTSTEISDILNLSAKYKHFMLVLNVGGPVDLTPVAQVPNILVLSQLGVETGLILADIVRGRMNPSGKLTTSWAAQQELSEIGEFGCMDDTRYKEGVYVGYRYYDTVGRNPEFGFGHGLSYTTFSVDSGRIRVGGSKVTMEVMITNTGAYAGKEVAQLYVSCPQGKLDKPSRQLAGWYKSSLLQPGESENGQILFDIRDLASYDEAEAQYILEAGPYGLYVGTSLAAAEPCGILDLSQNVVVRQVKNRLGKPDFEDWTPETIRTDNDGPVIRLDASMIETENVMYDASIRVIPEAKELTREELATLGVGYFAAGKGLMTMIGQSSTQVAGAAGETSSIASAKGFKPVVMADGPAGVRISKDYVIGEDGVKSIGGGALEGMDMFMNLPMKAVMKLMESRPKKGQEVMHQYATAIPIGTAIAQSWNTDFAKVCGDVVGAEMERFGVHLWLAPALNIHRDMRCGRNFEYYSEDPLISGKMAAAITLGVQQHPGCGVTIKHYAANNQETNRYFNNSMVSERAMREVYLKGFEICVREASPKAVMSSYNLLNGVHTSEHKGLIRDILRSEFGFTGIVMTDWVISGNILGKGGKYGRPSADLVLEAGHDLFMPGSQSDLDTVKKALEDGTLSETRLLENATRIYELIREFDLT